MFGSCSAYISCEQGLCPILKARGQQSAREIEREPAAVWTEGKFAKEEEEEEEDELVQDKWKRVEIFKCPGMPLLRQEAEKDT